MADNDKTLTSAEFSKITGISVSKINQMLRKGQLHGEKRSGKWAIPKEELHRATIASHKRAPQASAGSSSTPSTQGPKPSGKRYDVETFARMTYLTENGVRQWLRTGRLSGGVGEDGEPFVNAANLERSDLQHLIRH